MIQGFNSPNDYTSPANYTSLTKQRVAIEIKIGFAVCENATREIANWSGVLGSVLLTASVFEVKCYLILEHRPF